MYQTPTQQSRMVVQNKLEALNGVRKVYFQPPPNIKLEYPCIIYELSNYVSNEANNALYLDWPRYTVTVISKDPEYDIPRVLRNTKGDFSFSFDRFFTYDNLNHWVFDLTVTKSIEKEQNI